MIVRPDPHSGLLALTVRQPYASQLISGVKPVEFRTWNTDYRGDLLITASASPRSQGPSGVCVGIVELYDITDPDGDVYHWHCRNGRPVKLLPVKGRLQLWDVPDDVVRALGLRIVLARSVG